MLFLSVLGLLLCPWVEAAPRSDRGSAIIFDIYDPSRIVSNATGPECPTTNVLFDKETEFNYEELPKYQAHLRDQSVSQRCQALAISDMAVCYVDRSYSIKHGCCSKRCSQGFKRVIEFGCGIEFRVATCKQRSAWPILIAVDALSKRCANHTELTCQEALAEPLEVLLARHRADSSGDTANTPAASSVVTTPPKSGRQTSSGGHSWRSAGAGLFSAVALAALL